MPIGYPGNAITKEARAKAGGGFESAIEAAGGVAGGTSALAWSVQNSLSDQEEITLTTDTYTFESPEKLVWLGFGEGWLYSQADGTPFTDVTVGSETLDYEFGAGSEARFVQTVDGLKVLRSTLSPGGDSINGRCGFINWDTGSDIGNDTHVFMFSRTRCSDGTIANAPFQWKQERVRDQSNLNGESSNSAYVSETTPGGSGGRVIAYSDFPAVESYSGPVPVHGNGWYSFGWSWKPNTPDLSDGGMSLARLSDGATGLTVDINPLGNGGLPPTDTVVSSTPERPRFVTVQDFISNNDQNTQDIVIERTDIYWQRGGTLFFLTDNVDPSLATAITPLRVNSVPDSQTAKLKLWKSTMPDYTGKAVLVYDGLMNFIAGVSL